jgi:type I restriction enzyme R subunit
MVRIMNEFQIDQLAISLLTGLGYNYTYGPDIAPDSQTPVRAAFEDVLLIEKPKSAVERINPSIAAAAR